jgi:alpha-glucosidase
MEITLQDSCLRVAFAKKTVFVEPLSPAIVRFSDTEKPETPARVLHSSYKDFAYREQKGSFYLEMPLFTFVIKENGFVEIRNKEGRLLLKEIPYEYVSSVPTDHLAEREGHELLGGERYAFLRAFAYGGEDFYGLGDHPGPLNRKEREFVDWNTDDPHAHEDNFPSLYKSVPFLLVRKEKASFGLFLDNSFKSVFNLGVDHKEWFLGATDGPQDLYFMYGPTPKEVVSNFAKLVGVFPLPPRWALGYGQSRWSYKDEAAVREVVASYEMIGVPLSSVYLDIDYMEGYRVFTVSKERFPHLKELVEELHQKHIKVVTILDPGVKVDPAYGVYADGLKRKMFATLEGETYVNDVWPGPSVFPTFNLEKTRDWWGNLCKTLLDYGIDGLWVDMNEPASFKGPLPLDVSFGGESHAKIHNLYGHYMAEATFEGIKKATGKRPFVITRACYAGTQRYSTVWTGDNQSLWSHLHLAVPQQLSMGLSLMPFVGTDIGGFSGNCPSELMARWIWLGALSPLMRNHSDCACHLQEGYRYPAAIQKIYRDAVTFRYRLIPYLYDLLFEETQDGLPLLRPLFLEDPDGGFSDENTEMMVGPSLLAAPILDSGARQRAVLFPKGKWYSFFEGQLYNGQALEEAPLNRFLLYAKEGSVIPLYPEGYTNLDQEPDTLCLKAFPGQGSLLHYQDDGETYAYEKGAYNLYRFDNDNGKITVRLLHEGLPKYRKILVEFQGKSQEIALG